MNPGPSAGGSIRLGLLNGRSVVLLIRHNKLEIIVITEKWIPADARDAVANQRLDGRT